MSTHGRDAALDQRLANPPRPWDGPDYHADLAFWKEAVRALGASEAQIEAAVSAPPVSPELEFPFDLYATSEVVTASDVRPGDTVANLAPSRRYVRNPRDLIRVSRVVGGDIFGYRIFPQEWERDVEYTIVAAQIEDRHLRRVELPK